MNFAIMAKMIVGMQQRSKRPSELMLTFFLSFSLCSFRYLVRHEQKHQQTHEDMSMPITTRNRCTYNAYSCDASQYCATATAVGGIAGGSGGDGGGGGGLGGLGGGAGGDGGGLGGGDGLGDGQGGFGGGGETISQQEAQPFPPSSHAWENISCTRLQSASPTLGTNAEQAKPATHSALQAGDPSMVSKSGDGDNGAGIVSQPASNARTNP